MEVRVVEHDVGRHGQLRLMDRFAEVLVHVPRILLVVQLDLISGQEVELQMHRHQLGLEVEGLLIRHLLTVGGLGLFFRLRGSRRRGL